MKERCVINEILVSYAKCIQQAIDSLERQRAMFRETNRKPTPEEEASMKELDETIMRGYKNIEEYYQDCANGFLDKR